MKFAVSTVLLPRDPGGTDRPVMHNQLFDTSKEAREYIKWCLRQNVPMKHSLARVVPVFDDDELKIITDAMNTCYADDDHPIFDVDAETATARLLLINHALQQAAITGFGT